jgi:hypothetical protein
LPMAFTGQYNRCAIWQDGKGDRKTKDIYRPFRA